MRGLLGVAMVVAVAGCDLVFPPGKGPETAGDDAPGEWRKVSTGLEHVCAIAADSTLWCWGRNDFSALGDNTTVDRNVPVKIAGTATWSSVSAGYFHSCAIQTDGALYCWGYDFSGELGGDSPGPRAVPSQVVDHAAWAEVSAGQYFTCGIKAGAQTLWCWGDNDHGQLGTDTSGDSSTPTEVKDGGQWLHVAAGGNFACAIKVDSTLWCWGDNTYAQLGADTGASPKPKQASPDTGWTAIAAGDLHACGLRAGAAMCWGYSGDGEVGSGTTDPAAPIMAVSAPVATWTAIDAGFRHSCGVATDGGVWCWGYRERGAFGGGTDDIAGVLVPVQLTTAPPADAVSTGRSVTCIRGSADGALACTGANAFGQLGDGSGGARFEPAFVTDGASQIATGGKGGGFSCAVLANGVSCWGADDQYQHGDGISSDSRSPRFRDAAQPDVMALGGTHGCEVRGSTLWCWGANDVGQVGDGTFLIAPVPTSRGGGWIPTLSAKQHTCGFGTMNDLWCWGDDSSFQLGDGMMVNQSAPEHIDWGVTVRAVAAGERHTCAIETPDDSLWCWGGNDQGELGLGGGDRDERPNPVQVPTGPSWHTIDAGTYHTCAIESGNGVIDCWGWNPYGALGTGTLADADTPTAIDSGLSFRAVSAGGYHTCAIADDDTLWCWGYNHYGETGAAGPDVILSPRQVGTETWSTIDAAEYHTCGIRTNGSVWCWGFDGRGEIGDGSAWRPSLGRVGGGG